MALLELQRSVTASRRKGEKVLRGIWQFIAFSAFLGFVWFFLHRLTHEGVTIDKLAFFVIGGLGLVVITVLMSGDAFFFNSIYDREHELERRQSALAAATLGIPESAVMLRYAAAKQYFILTVTKENEGFVAEKISLETKTTSLAFHILTTSFEELIGVLARDKDRITRN